MSIKEVSKNVTEMFKVPSDGQSLRIGMQNLKLKGHQEEEYVSRNIGGWNGMHSAEAPPDETKKVEQVNRRRRTLTEKGREYRISILDKKKSSLVSSIIKKSSEINDLFYSYQNATTV